MKAIIPVAGVGSKLRPYKHNQPKALMPLADKPILAHIVEELVKAGIQEFVFIIGSLGYKVQQYITTNYKDLKTTFVVQEPRQGSAHAIWTAREHIQDEEGVVIAYGDTIVNINLKKFINIKISAAAVKKVDNPSLFGIAEVNRESEVTKFIEKPRIPKSNLALVGLFKINNVAKLLGSIEHIINNKMLTYGEYHLTDALMQMVREGERMTVVEVNHWYDCGRLETLLEANETMLKRPQFRLLNQDEFPGSIVIPPVSIGKKCSIINSIVGPNVAIGDNTSLRDCIAKNTIIGSDSEVANVVLHNSVIGNDSTLRGSAQNLNLDDDTSVDLGC